MLNERNQRELFATAEMLTNVNELLIGTTALGGYLIGTACALCAVAGFTPSRELLIQVRDCETREGGFERIEQWLKARSKLKRRAAREALP